MATRRPQTLADYVGQKRVKSILELELRNGGQPRHTLVYGRQGLGKTSLSLCLANDADLRFVHWQATAAMTARTLAQALYDLPVTGYAKDGTPGPDAVKYCLFLDEVHSMNSAAFEVLYSPLEDRELRPDPNGGVSWLPIFTMVAATTDPNQLPGPFADRFPLKLRLDPYSAEDLAEMVRAKFPALDGPDAMEVAKRSKGSARQAVDYAESVVRHGLEIFELYEVDSEGWTPLDRAVIAALRKANRPLSLNTLAAMVRENPATIRDVVEPALLSAGLMEIGARGRSAVGFEDPAASRGGLIVYTA